MAGRVRFRVFLFAVVILLLLAVAAHRVLYRYGRPPATHPVLPVSAEPVSLTTSTPTEGELRSLVAGSNIVICVIDGARVDHIGCYGYSRDTTPNMDRLAGQSLVFEQHFCQYPQTKPSTASLFTSLYPDSHLTFARRTMAGAVFTMAQGLKAAGFHNGFFSSNHWASPQMGIGGDFDWIGRFGGIGNRSAAQGDRGSRSSPGKRSSKRVRSPEALLALMQEWLEQPPPQPFSAYCHFLPPHHPYSAPDEFKEVFAGKPVPGFWQGKYPFRGIVEKGGPAEHKSPTQELVNLYDANLLWADWAVGEVERLLREAGVFDDTLFIVTADHGETFGEHGYKWHPPCPYDEVIRIPLLIKLPGDKGPVGRVRALTQTIDLLPTILDLCQAPYPREEVQGRSLVPLLTGESDKINDYNFARTTGTLPAYVVHDLRWALLLYEGGKLRALY
ncbi:MAG: sulfatase, partial [Armatimonadota bacterium]